MADLLPAALDAPSQPRTPGFDALRGALTVLVVFHHTAITYGALGGWFYREVEPSRSVATALLVIFCSVNQAFFMGLFFLLAGYFTPPALRRKGAVMFLADRFLRLGLPMLFFGWVLGPTTIALAATHRGQPFATTLFALWRRGLFEIGPLWFAEALLIFALASVVAAQLPWRTWMSFVAAEDRPLSAPNWLLFAAALGTGLASVVLRLWWPVGINVWNLQLAYFSGYVVLFVAGCAAARRRRLERLDPAQVRLWGRLALIALPTLPALGFLREVMPAFRAFPIQLFYAFWEPFVAWGIILVLLQGFLRHFAEPGGRFRPFWLQLGRRAYAIYIIHPPILVGTALVWSTVPAPALLKVLVTGSASCALCYLVAGPLVRLPGLRRIL